MFVTDGSFPLIEIVVSGLLEVAVAEVGLEIAYSDYVGVASLWWNVLVGETHSRGLITCSG